MMESAEGNRNEYSIEFRIKIPFSDATDPSEMLGLDASHFRRLEEQNACWWGFNGGEKEEPLYWADFSEGLEFILGKLESRSDAVDRLREKYDCIWWCGHFHGGFDGGPTISPELLRRLSNIGVELFIDTYCDQS